MIKGYAIKEPNEIMYQAMKERKPTIIEAYVDPFEPPMLRKVEMEFVKVVNSFAKGQPYAKKIGLTLFRDQVHDIFEKYTYTHYVDRQKMAMSLE